MAAPVAAVGAAPATPEREMSAEEMKDASIGVLVRQLVDDGRALVRAELRLYRQIALYRTAKAKAGVAALGIALLLAVAGLIGLVVGLVLGLAALIGPVAAGAAMFFACALLAALLGRFGVARMAALAGDPEEKAALQRGALP